MWWQQALTCWHICRIMLESFISTQKLSVQKALRRKFKRFIVAKSDFDQLVLFKLQVRGGAGPVLRIGRFPCQALAEQDNCLVPLTAGVPA